jgi:hypothetical protein
VSACVFVGPTLWRDAVPREIARFGPAALGSVFRAVEAGHRRIGIVDGLFGNAPAVWHKEILFALSKGIEVLGAASMGALRAAELAAYGMSGVGAIYRMYRRGSWSDDDEVAVLHAPRELSYQPLSESMADIRSTLRRMRAHRAIDAVVEAELVRRMKSIHFSARTEAELDRQWIDVLGAEQGGAAAASFRQLRVEAKRRDGLALIARMAARGPVQPTPRPDVFAPTRHWQRQFVARLADIPPLR